jgi:hypothetical protein
MSIANPNMNWLFLIELPHLFLTQILCPNKASAQWEYIEDDKKGSGSYW